MLDFVRKHRPEVTEQELEELGPHLPTHPDNDSFLREDLELVRGCKYIRKELAESVIGLWLDLETGKVRVVE